MKPITHTILFRAKQLGLLSCVTLSLALSFFACRNESFHAPQNADNNTVDKGYVLIPDDNFRAYLKANVCPNAFATNSKYMNTTHDEVKGFTDKMTIDGATNAIKSVKGVEYFVNMKVLVVKNTDMDSLVLTNDMALDSIYIQSHVNLQYVSVAGCKKLRYADFRNCPFTELSFANFPILNYTTLVNLTRLTSLNVTGCSELEHIITSGLISIPTIDTSTNPKLKRLFLLYSYALTSVDVTKNVLLRIFATSYASNFKSIDVTKCPNLMALGLDVVGIQSIDVSKNPQLFSLGYSNGKVKKIDLSANPNIHDLVITECYNLEELDVRSITSFDYYVAKLTNDDFKDLLTYKDGFASAVKTSVFSVPVLATRKALGDKYDITGGIWTLGMAGCTNFRTLRVNEKIKDNYEFVKISNYHATPPVQIVYDANGNITCADYNPVKLKCNQ